jgi:glycosyltransferase involved in cell wall biosynthesis
MEIKNLSIIILAGNEEKMIANCLESCRFASEIIIVAANSTDNTKDIVKKISLKWKKTIKIVETQDEYNKNFSKWRNLGYKNANKEWLLYIDADEIINDKLKQEIINTISHQTSYSHYALPRANHFLGKRVKYGGTYPDYVKRLFKKDCFKGYQGYLHEEPIIKGELSYLKNDLFHFTHRNISSMIDKTNAWTDMEAQALYDSQHPPVYWWRFPRMILTKFYQRLIKEKMYKDGIVGWISAIFESFDTFIIYAKLWELQQKTK